MKISERIFMLLDERGMSQKEFSDRTGISQTSISDWKRKKTNPNAEKIMIICDVLGVSPFDLLQDTIRGDSSVADIIMVSKGTIEHMLIEKVQVLPAESKLRVLSYAEAMADQLGETKQHMLP